MSPLVDIGANLGHRRFAADLAEVLDRARAAGVESIVVTGTSERASVRADALARARPATLYCTAGVHPHEARTFGPGTAGVLRALARSDRVVAIGECGLDYDRDFSPRPAQRRAFEAQLELAVELRLPVFLHEREAREDFVGILERYRAELTGGVVHCFTGEGAALDAYLAMDLHVGITGWICDPRRGAHLLEILDRVPSDRLMIETDAPFLTPPGALARRNEPAHLPYVLDAVARATGRPAERVARETTDTARRFFALDAQGKGARPGT